MFSLKDCLQAHAVLFQIFASLFFLARLPGRSKAHLTKGLILIRLAQKKPRFQKPWCN